MGACNQHCLKQKEEESDDLLVLPKNSLTSIQWDQKESLSTNDSQEDSWESPEDSEHLCTASRNYRKGNYQSAINEFMLALHAICKDQSAFAQVHTRIARCYFRLGRHSLAAQHCRVALNNAQERGFREEAVTSAELMGEIKLAQQDCILAVFYYEKALRGWEELGKEGKRIELMYSLGMIHMDLHNHDKVLEHFETLLVLQIEDDHSNVGPIFKIHLYLARIYAIRGRYEESIRCFARCLQVTVKKSEEYRETAFEFRQMAVRMRETCSFQELLRLQSLISATATLRRLAEV